MCSHPLLRFEPETIQTSLLGGMASKCTGHPTSPDRVRRSHRPLLALAMLVIVNRDTRTHAWVGPGTCTCTCTGTFNYLKYAMYCHTCVIVLIMTVYMVSQVVPPVGVNMCSMGNCIAISSPGLCAGA